VNDRARLAGLVLAACGAVLFSAKAILAKFQYRLELDSLDVLALRMLFALPLFLVLAVREASRARARGAVLSWSDRGTLLLIGLLGYYLSSLLDFWGLEYVPVSLERLILFLNPTFVLLIGLLAFGRKVQPRQWLAMAISYAGVALVMVENLRVQGDHIAFGSALVLGAALCYAIYLAVSGELIKRVGALRLVAYAMCISTAATLLHFALVRAPGGLLAHPGEVYALAATNALFCTFLPVTFTMAAVARIGSATTAQLSVIGPVSLVFLGHWLLGEAITPLQIAGTMVVLAGVYVLTRPAANSVPIAASDDER
jgi:drug/metabolite transporter (DMT)-like permease